MMVSEPNTGNSMMAANVSGQRTAKSTTPKRESDMGLVFVGFGVGNAGDEMAKDRDHDVAARKLTIRKQPICDFGASLCSSKFCNGACEECATTAMSSCAKVYKMGSSQ